MSDDQQTHPDEPTSPSCLLSEDQKLTVRNAFNFGGCPDLSALTRKVFSNNLLDARSKEGRAIKEYIKDFNLGKISIRDAGKAKPKLILTEEQREKIKGERGKEDFSVLFFTKKIFNKPDITPLHQEFRAVSAFLKELEDKEDEKSLNLGEEGEFKSAQYIPSDGKDGNKEEKLEPYRAPMTIPQTIARINKYLNLDWKVDNLKKIQLKQATALFGYLKVFRFQYQINSYGRPQDRELFEDAFIRYSFDKEDLTQEEIDQFITLSNEVVIAADIQRRIEILRSDLDDTVGVDDKKISMGLNEAINNAQTEYNQCISRQDKLYKALTTNRSKRIEKRLNENASILNIVQAWKHEENREKLIALANKRKIALGEEAQKLSSMDEWKAVIRGLDPQELSLT